MDLWDEIWFIGIIFEAKQDRVKIFQKFENFQQSRNKLWIQPFNQTEMYDGWRLINPKII